MSNNGVGFHGVEHISTALKGHKTVTELNVAENNATNAMDGTGKTSMSGLIALASAIKDMRALAELDISSNGIGAEQEGDLQRICAAGGIELDKQTAHSTWAHRHQRQ